MVQDDRRLREGARRIRQLHQLRVIEPSLEGQVQRREPSKPGPPGRIGLAAGDGRFRGIRHSVVWDQARTDSLDVSALVCRHFSYVPFRL